LALRELLYVRVFLKLFLKWLKSKLISGVYKMPSEFFRDIKKINPPEQDSLDSRKEELVNLMIPVIQTYHKLARPSQEETKTAIASNIESLITLMKAVFKNINNEEINPTEQDPLGSRDEELVILMIPVIKKTYNKLASPSPEKTKTAIVSSIKPLNELMGMVLASIIKQQNKAMAAAIQAADEAPYSGY
jgi:hypothetical protein